MAALTWDEAGTRTYETGVSKGVLYPFNSTSKAYDKGVAWNGLISVTESPTGAEANNLYADNMKYLEMRSAEELEGTIEAYTYPDEFAVLDGTAAAATGVYIGQQTRAPFALCYRTILGNDSTGEDYGYKLHLIYGMTASPSEKAYSTVNDNPEAIEFSWEFTTTPINVNGYKPISSITIDSTKADKTKLAALEAQLYGSSSETAKLPLPSEVISMFATGT